MAASGKNVVGPGTLALDKLTIASTVSTDGIVINTDKFSVAADSGNTAIGGTLGVTGTITAAAINSTGTHAITGALTVSTTAGITGNATVGGTLGVTGNLTVGSSKLVVTAASGNIVGKGTAGFGTNGTEFTVAATGNTAIGGTLTVTGATVLNGGLTMDTDKFTVAADTGNTAVAGTLAVTGTSALTGAVTITGALNANGGIACDDDKFTVANTSGNTAVGGTLAVTGVTTLTGALIANGGISIANGTKPASAGAAGTANTVIIDDDGIYYCIATNTWVKTAMATW
jgi:hypothetical protein